ncbi:MAG: hypothetical protein KTR26_08825 [Flammeovirgaceae bacterium]|nr:hypothetical protein [Flammeovirgaceae bacterium]
MVFFIDQSEFEKLKKRESKRYVIWLITTLFLFILYAYPSLKTKSEIHSFYILGPILIVAAGIFAFMIKKQDLKSIQGYYFSISDNYFSIVVNGKSKTEIFLQDIIDISEYNNTLIIKTKYNKTIGFRITYLIEKKPEFINLLQKKSGTIKS